MFAILSSGKFNVTSGLNDKSGFGMPKIVIPSPLLFVEDGLTPFAFNLIVLFVRNEPSNSFFFRDEKLYNYFTDNSNVGCVATSVSVIENPF